MLRRSRVSAIWIVLAIAGVVDATHVARAAAAEAADHRVAVALESANLEHVVDDDNDFRIVFSRPGGRTQVAWIASATTSVGGLELRELWSVALRGTGEPPSSLTARLLEDNAARAVGAWQLQRSGGEYLVVLSAPVLATADAATLLPQLIAVAAGADQMELELTGHDAF